MAEYPYGPNITGDSKEAVAWAMTQALANEGGYKVAGGTVANASAEWVLHAYAACLKTVKDPSAARKAVIEFNEHCPPHSG